jgi:4-carboxymuconolactone decarboxylase
MPRLPEIYNRDEIAESERHAFDYLIETRGNISPGFAAMLSHPELTQRIAHVGTLIRLQGKLPANVRELASLAVSVEMDASFEMRAHARAAAAAGVDAAVIETVNESGPLEGLSEDERLAVDCARQLMRDHQLAHEDFGALRARYGDRGVMELIGVIGYYAMIAILHNALEVQAPAG